MGSHQQRTARLELYVACRLRLLDRGRFPGSDRLEIADSLDISGSLGSSSQLAGRSDSELAAHAETLTGPERNRYVLTFLGETDTDVAGVDATGALPEGRNDFATGGCLGAAWDAIPGLYELRSELLREVREAKAAELATAAPCVTAEGVRIASLQALEAAYERDSSSRELKACEGPLVKTNEMARERANATVLARHEARLLEQERRYQSALVELKSDRAFLEYLDGVVTGLERKLVEGQRRTAIPRLNGPQTRRLRRPGTTRRQRLRRRASLRLSCPTEARAGRTSAQEQMPSSGHWHCLATRISVVTTDPRAPLRSSLPD